MIRILQSEVNSRFPDRREYLDARMVETRAMGTVTVDELLVILDELREANRG